MARSSRRCCGAAVLGALLRCGGAARSHGVVEHLFELLLVHVCVGVSVRHDVVMPSTRGPSFLLRGSSRRRRWQWLKRRTLGEENVLMRNRAYLNGISVFATEVARNKCAKVVRFQEAEPLVKV